MPIALPNWGRSAEALARIKIAIDLNPTSVFHQMSYGRVLHFARQYDDAITQQQRVAEMDSANPAVYAMLCRSYYLKGDHLRAYESFMKYQQVRGTDEDEIKSYESTYAKSGREGVLLKHLEFVKASNKTGAADYYLAELSAVLGQSEQSIRYLDRAVNSRSLQVSSIGANPSLDSLHGDPRFDKLVRSVGRQ